MVTDSSSPTSSTGDTRTKADGSSSNSSESHVARGGTNDHDPLNTYGFYPTTVPPFVLDSQIEKVNTRVTHTPSKAEINDCSQFNLKDPFLVTYDGKWGDFAQNIGSNVAYPKQAHARLSLDQNSTSSNNSDIEKQSNTDGSSLIEREKAGKQVLKDLNGEWGGGKRLEKLFNTPIAGNYEFKNNEDRKAWYDYVTKIKQFYYGEGSNWNPTDNKSRLEQMERGTAGRRNPDWVEELNRDRLKFKQVKQQKLQQWMPALKRLLLDNQYLPLGLRIVVGVLSVVSLGLAVRIFQNSSSRVAAIQSSVDQEPSTIMAICVNAIAVVYIVCIAHDEFSGKPLGLRNPFGKLRLILLDLLFIIFCSANLALAFNTLFDPQWVCTNEGGSTGHTRQYPKIPYICEKQRALSSFLFVMLFMWILTFTVSIVRVVEKVSSSPRD